MRRISKNLLVTVKDNSSAYGYSITITGTYAILGHAAKETAWFDLLLGAAGAALAFLALELAAIWLVGRTRDSDAQSTRFLSRLMDTISILCALGAALACAILLPPMMRWFSGGFLATVTFVLLQSFELRIAEESGKRRRR